MKITIINGPNLNLLGSRETDIYGNQNFDSYLDSLKTYFPKIEIDYFQSNIEGEIINYIHDSKNCNGIILNAAAYTHTSVGIADAVKSINCKVIEVHISNTYSREEFRHNSFLSPVVDGIIIGFGLYSYRLALESLIKDE
tara:strand:+ start:976 stop:1395 length:420 start_codon:yes stop_codon:yes gene_type:complete